MDSAFESLAFETVGAIRHAIARDGLTITTATTNLDKAVWEQDCGRQVSGDLDLEPAVYWLAVVTVLRHDLGVTGATSTPRFGHGHGDGGGDDGRRDHTAGHSVQP